jgi:UDP-glucose 4-epimerase
VITGIRPGEKVHEILVSEEEAHRTVARNGYYTISPILPELDPGEFKEQPLGHEYSSADNLMSFEEVKKLLQDHELLLRDRLHSESELLR